MIDFLRAIFELIWDSIVALFNVITSIPTLINEYKGGLFAINLTNNPYVTSILIVIISILVAIRIKRLIV